MMPPQSAPIDQADLRRLFNALPGLYLVLTPDLIIQMASDAYLAATFTQRSELIGRYLFDAFPDNPAAPEARAVANLRRSLTRVIARQQPHTMPVQRYDVRDPATGNFEMRYWKVVNTLVLGGAGRLLYLIHRVKDVTQPYLKKQLNRRNEELLNVVLQTINDVIWDWNLLTNEVKWSEGFHTKFGYPIQETDSTNTLWYARIHPDDKDRIVTSIHHAIEQGLNSWSNAYRFRQKNGSYADILDRGVVLRDDAQQPYRMIGSMVDITDQVRANRAAEELTTQLRAEKEKFQFLAETIPQFIWTTDPQGFHDYFNQRWIDYTGYTVADSQGTEMWNNLLHPDDRARARQRWSHSLQTGDFYEIEYRFKSQAGGYRWFLGQAMPMRDPAGQITKWFGTCTDIEEKKRAEEELLQINQELRKTNEDLDSFVYTGSHDLKLPIVNMARIFQELTHSTPFLAPDAAKLIAMFQKSLEQINTTIQDLGDIVQVQKNLEQNQERVSFAGVTDEVQLSIQDMVEEAQARIITDFSAAPEIYFSRANLKSIIYNLLSNAIKYRSPERSPVVRLQTVIKAEFIVLTVQDNGLGINLARHQGKLFQMFKRFHSHVTGSGIGLYIVNRIVQNQGGHIELTSNLNEGTTFQLFLKKTDQNA